MNPSFCFIVRMFDFVQNNRIMRKRFRDNDFFMFSEVHASFRLHSEFFVTDKLSDMIQKERPDPMINSESGEKMEQTTSFRFSILGSKYMHITCITVQIYHMTLI